MPMCTDCRHCATHHFDEPCFSCLTAYFGGSGKKAGFEPLNPYWNNICKMADRQRAKGIATYGQGLESNPADIVKRIEYLQEELIDGLMYCEWIKDELKKMEGFENGNLPEQN